MFHRRSLQNHLDLGAIKNVTFFNKNDKSVCISHLMHTYNFQNCSIFILNQHIYMKKEGMKKKCGPKGGITLLL